MRYLVIFLTILLISTKCYAKHLYLELEYQNFWCDSHNGITEYKLKDFTRVDCLTEKQAIEFDFAPKWAECIGQALHYGIMTGKEPACCLIMERGEKDLKYLKRLRRVGYKKGIRTYTIRPTTLIKHNILPKNKKDLE